jgi:hypothetical protein
MLIIATLNGCSSRYSIVSQEQLVGNPCGKLETGVNVRIRNTGKTTFSKFTLELSGDRKLIFPGLKRGELTCFKNTSTIWTNNSYNVSITKNGFTVTLIAVGTDHVGEHEINHGDITIDVFVRKTHKGFKTTAHFNVDTN